MAGLIGTTKMRVLLYRQIGMLLRSGQSLRDTLLLVSDFPARTIAARLAIIQQQLLAGGDPISAIRDNYPVFPDFPVDILARQISPANLGQLFYAFAEQQEKLGDMRRRMLRAFVYPAVILTIGILVFSLLIIFVLPQFKHMYDSFGGELPVLTQMVFQTGEAARYLLLPVLVALVALLIILFKNPIALFPLGVRLPLLGGLLRRVSVYLLTRQLSAYLAAGIPLTDALQLCRNTLKRYPYANDLSQLIAAAPSVEALGQHLSAHAYFPKILAQMVHIGDKGGDLPGVLKEFSDFYENEIEADYFRLLVTTETGSLLMVAFLVGCTVIAMYLPIFGLAGNV